MKVLYKSFMKDTIKEIESSDRKARAEAAKYLVKKIKTKISDVYFKGKHSQAGEPPGMITGNLKKNIDYTDTKDKQQTIVGVKRDAFYGHMLEFGTNERHARIKKSGRNKRYVGKVDKRPFLFSTFEEEQNAVKEILSKRWM